MIALLLIVCVQCALLCGEAASALREPYRELLDWSSLPVITNDRCVHLSSADPTGGNQDFNHFVRDNPDGSKVLAELTGPGCVTHLWFTLRKPSPSKSPTLRFYFDGQGTPTISMRVLDFFQQSTPPFSPPLIGQPSQSSGGYYSYLPIPFGKSCRIEVADLGDQRFYYNLDATLYASHDTVETFTWPLSPHREQLASRLIDQWNAAGEDPKGTIPGTRAFTETHQLPPRQTRVFFNLSGKSRIVGLKVRSKDLSREILRNLWLQILWNREEEPSVNVPLGDFFGTGPSGKPFRGLAFGRIENELYCYFPMPYEKGALIRVQNRSATSNPTVEMELAIAPYPESGDPIGRFFAAFNSEIPAQKPENYLLMKFSGAGDYLGTVVTIAGGFRDSYAYLEGDEMISVDGEETPSILGTGTEDYFNGGWYYEQGEFACPLHGLPCKEISLSETTQYRIHLLDKVPFSRHLLATIEHGANNTVRADYRSVAFAYAVPGEPFTPPISPPTPTPKPGENLLVNPGAESGMVGWMCGGTPTYAPQLDPETHIPKPPHRSGNHRFGLSVGWKTADCYQYQTVKVTPGATYEAGLWFTRRTGKGETLEVLWIDGPWPGPETNLYLSEGPEVASWTPLSGRTFVPRQGKVTLVIRYRSLLGSDICSTHVDDVYLKQVKPAEGKDDPPIR